MTDNIITSSCGNTTILADDNIPNVLHFSTEAKEKIIELTKNETPGTMFRIGVAGGGCSGFEYVMGFDTTEDEGDILFNLGSDQVAVVDSESMRILKDSTLKFVKDITGENFKVDNPHAKSQCGCGSSFSIDFGF